MKAILKTTALALVGAGAIILSGCEPYYPGGYYTTGYPGYYGNGCYPGCYRVGCPSRCYQTVTTTTHCPNRCCLNNTCRVQRQVDYYNNYLLDPDDYYYGY